MKKAILIVAIILIAIQLITIDKENPPADDSNDFIYLNDPPAEVAEMIKTSCYDCHSHQTKYPWYSNVAPASWLLKNHVNDGRNHLNFSIWTDYKERKQNHKIEECIEVISNGEMPMKGYIIFHSEADLTESQREKLVNWFSVFRDSLNSAETELLQ